MTARPKRVVIFGWAESVHVQRWARGLQKRGYKVKLISLGGEPLDDIDTTVFDRRGKHSYLFSAGAAVRGAREFEPDLIHVHYAGAFGLWSLRTRFTPTVVSVWGSDVVGFPGNPIARGYLRRVLHRCAAVTATSNHLRDVTVSVSPEISQKLSIIPFGVDIKTLSRAEGMSHLPNEPVKLCYIKSHRPVYGPDTLLKALSLIDRRTTPLHLTMAGSGPLTNELRNMVSKLGIASSVEFAGQLAPEDVYRLIERSHVVVMPSRQESFGVAALEASACGRPVIASRVGGVPEVVLDGETGILVPPNDVDALAGAIKTLADDAAMRERLGNAGRDFVKKNYSWDRSLDMMCELYDRLIDEKAQSQAIRS